jgi:hypothetical protein
MILRPLTKIHSRFYILKIGDKEVPFENRMEYSREKDERPARQSVITPDGREFPHDTAFLQEFGVVAPWNRETGMVDGKHVEFFPAGPPDAMLILLHECTLQLRDCYFRDHVQEKQEREGSKPFTKLPLEYLTNLIDLTDKEHDMITRCLQRQIAGKKGEIADPPPPPEPTSEELSNIDELAPPELETLIGKLEAHHQWDTLKQTARQKAARFACLKQAHQSQRCGYIKPNGLPCGSPAIKGETLCHWHSEARLQHKQSEGPLLDATNGNLSLANQASGEARQESVAFELPVLEDRLGVQLGIMRVCSLLASRSIDPYTARVMLYGLRLAQRTVENDGLATN